MTAKERILAIRLLEKMEGRPDIARKIEVSAGSAGRRAER